jgi:tRNA pseudouridine13 synthase
MSFEPLAPPPLLTADLPGVGGRIKSQPDDFEVEEVPAYRPSGQGDHLYLWVEKRGLGAEFFVRQVARRLGLAPGEVGTAGLKDRHAVTRQWLSVPAAVQDRLGQLDGDGIRVLAVERHGNKLKPGHLHGNRFRILIRGAEPEASGRLPLLLERLRRDGLPNFYGPQRFGRGGETVAAGLALLRGQAVRRLSPFLRKLALSAAQSALFNHYLGSRMSEGMLRTVLPGDVLMHWPHGKQFVAEEVAAEQARFEAWDAVPAGPMFGRKLLPARDAAAEREARTLADAGLTLQAFHGHGKLLQGTRRHNLIRVDDLSGAVEPDGVRLTFTLPAGSYATVLLREVTRTEPDEDEGR